MRQRWKKMVGTVSGKSSQLRTLTFVCVTVVFVVYPFYQKPLKPLPDMRLIKDVVGDYISETREHMDDSEVHDSDDSNTIKSASNASDNNTTKPFSSFNDANTHQAEMKDEKHDKELGTCKPQTSIAFIKTHKTAGSAVQNVLFRYGYEHGLIFALPRNSHDFMYPRLFKKGFIGRSGYLDHNIICHHMRFDYLEIQRSLVDEAAFLTILREPGKVFESSFNFFWDIILPYQRVSHNSENSMDLWLNNADEYSQTMDEWRPLEIYPYHDLCKNPNMFDLGFDNRNEDTAYVKSAIKKIQQIFDLVMIADYFTESMVLLADVLCWSLEDVACLPLNIQSLDKFKMSQADHLRISKKVRRWNKADAVLYDFFNATFWKRIKKYGYERMKRDADKLRNINKRLMRRCIEGETAVEYAKISNRAYKKSVFKPANVSVKGYNLKKSAIKIRLCKELIATEDQFSKILYRKHGYRTSAYY